jgi:hypothetical protein
MNLTVSASSFLFFVVKLASVVTICFIVTAAVFAYALTDKEILLQYVGPALSGPGCDTNPPADCICLATRGAGNWSDKTDLCSFYGVSCANATVVSAINLGGRRDVFCGVLPPQMSWLHGMTELDLAFNQLKGRLPAEWRNMSSLVSLELESNQLEGLLRPEWSNMTSLRSLRLDSNQLSGSLPPEWANWSSVQNLYLNGNQISGSLPPEWATWRSLQQLFLASNELSGN